MKQIITVLVILLAIVVLAFQATTMKSHSKKEHKNETLQEITDIKAFYMDYVVPSLYDGIHPMDTTQSEDFWQKYQSIADIEVKYYIQASENVYLSLCDIAEENISDDTILDEIYPLLQEILTMQLGVIQDYASTLTKAECLKSTDIELKYLHKLGDILEKDAIDKYMRTIRPY